MAFYYGLTNPCSFLNKNVEVNPDLFKFYTAVPTRSTESSAANKRRPVLYTSFNGGMGWNFESQSGNFYHANYGGNFYFNSDKYHLEAWAHKSVSSSYGAYKAACGTTETQSGIKLNTQNWTTSSVVAYNTANQPNREICKNIGTAYPDRYFCIKEGGGYVYNDNPWSTANWTTTSFNTSGTALNDDGGFKHICVDPEKDHDALVFFTTNDSNKYLRFYLCNLDNLTSPVDYTTTLFGATTRKQSEFRYVSIDYLPGVGYLIIYDYVSNNDFCVKILRTYDPVTGEHLPYNQYIMPDALVHVGTSDSKMVAYGNHGWYCPWTKEYFFVPNASQVFWTKDGINWNSSSTTPSSSSTACQKFLTDGTNMVIAIYGHSYYRSYNKGQTWSSGTSLSPDGFNTNRSNDTIVLPFKCVNNLGIDMNSIVLDEYYTSSGTIGTSDQNFRIDSYVSIDPSTSYIFFGKVIDSSLISHNVPIVRNSMISFYDVNKNFISRVDSNSWVTVGSGNYTICIGTSPSNAAYARVSCHIDDVKVTMEKINACKWYFAKESDFKVMTEYGDIVCN